MMLIARTDAESGKLISSNIDILDHPFILGTTNKGNGKGLAEVIAEAEIRGASGAQVDQLEVQWMAEHELSTFDQGALDHNFTLRVLCLLRVGGFAAVERAISNSSSVGDKAIALDKYHRLAAGKSNAEARKAALEVIGEEVFWDWDRTLILRFSFQEGCTHSNHLIVPRTREGYYHYDGGMEVRDHS